MESLEYTLNDVPLETENCIVTVGTSLLAPVSVRRTVTTVPGMPGSLPSHQAPLFEPRSVTIKFGIGGKAFTASTRRLYSLLLLGALTLGRTVDGMTQTTVAELESLSEDSSVLGRGATYTAVLALPDVWWLAEYPRYATGTKGAITIIPSTDGDGPFYWTEQLPDKTSVLYGYERGYGLVGDAPITNCILRIPAPVTSVTITDTFSATGISWTGNVTSGYLYLKPHTLEAWQSSSDSHWYAPTTLLNDVDYPATGPLVIWPDETGKYSINFAANGSGATSVTCQYYSAWW